MGLLGFSRISKTLDSEKNENKITQAVPKKLLTEWTPEELVDLKVSIHSILLSEIDVIRVANFDGGDHELRVLLARGVSLLLDERPISFISTEEKESCVIEILDEILGLGHLENFLRDPSITEIMVNGPHHVFVERAGQIETTDKIFLNDGQVLRITEKIVSSVGRRIDESSPMVDARLPDGSRVNAIIPPLSLSGPILTIRKFNKIPLTGEDLVAKGTMSSEMLSLLQDCVKQKLNILISGGTGSGKTTLLNVLSSFLSPKERIVTIEDAAELRLSQSHVISLEARPSNVEGKGEVAIRDLVKNSLRMRPDRIIVGEVRGAEALDMLQAMNTGHSGSLTTCHANSPLDALSRLEVMVLMGGMEIPLSAIRSQISNAIDVIIQQSRLSDGRRCITSIIQIDDLKDGQYLYRELFKAIRMDNGEIGFKKTSTLETRGTLELLA